MYVAIDMEYWTKVAKRLIIFLMTCLGLFLAFKLAVFYMPFLIAFIISLLVEPLIKLIAKKLNIERKIAAIVVLSIVSVILVVLLTFGIIAIISESSNLLQGLNRIYWKDIQQRTRYNSKYWLKKIEYSAGYYRNNRYIITRIFSNDF